MRMSLFGALFAAAFAGPVQAQDVTVQTATGPAEVAANPETVAVFDIAALDTLNAMGVSVAGVPSPVYLEALEDLAAAAQTVGTLFEPDFEELAVMRPDLIVVGNRSSVQTGALERIAPVIDMTIGGENLVEQARARIRAYGAIFSAGDKAEALIGTIDARLDDARSAVAGKGNALILLASGGKISAYGAGSRFGWLHTDLGLPEAVGGLEAENHGQSVSFEFVADADPDWLLVIDRGAAVGAEGEAAAATLDNPLIDRTTAARKGQIVYLDAVPLYIAGGGAGSLMHTLDEVVAAFGDAEG